MDDIRWEAIDIKSFIYSHKALLTSTKPFFGPPNSDMEPTVVKPKAKPVTTKTKTTSNSQMPAQ